MKVGSINYHRKFYICGFYLVLPSFCFYSVHIASLISRVARYTTSNPDNLPSNKIQKSDEAN